jgi:hypothetical protein
MVIELGSVFARGSHIDGDASLSKRRGNVYRSGGFQPPRLRTQRHTSDSIAGERGGWKPAPRIVHQIAASGTHVKGFRLQIHDR